jgi:hypothetical protein
MGNDKKRGKYTPEDMLNPQLECSRDRVKSGWKHVVKPTIDRLGIQPAETSIIDIGSADGRKSLKKYAYDRDNKNNFTNPSKYGLLTSNMAAIEGDIKKIAALKMNIPDGKVFHFNFTENRIVDIDIKQNYHIVLLCEILEHLPEGESQMNLLQDAASMVSKGGGMHVTFPRTTGLDCPMKKPWGHKCEEVPRHDVMNVLTKLFEKVTWAQSVHSRYPTVNFFAIGKLTPGRYPCTWEKLVMKHGGKQ